MTELEQVQEDLKLAEMTYLSTTEEVDVASKTIIADQGVLSTKLDAQKVAVTGYVEALQRAVAVETGLLKGFLPPTP